LRAQFLETSQLLPGYLLSAQGDRMALAHAVEGRYPFLDHRVVTLASKLPVSLKMKVLEEKYLLKRCADGLVPSNIRSRKKQPYRAPDGASFMGGAARPYLNTVLSEESIKRYGIFDPEAVSKLRAKFLSGRAIGTKDNMAFVGILSTQLLMHEFVDPDTRRTPANANTRDSAEVCL
jgi:asparagine synthase (glutamine-hydrolysing)